MGGLIKIITFLYAVCYVFAQFGFDGSGSIDGSTNFPSVPTSSSSFPSSGSESQIKSGKTKKKSNGNGMSSSSTSGSSEGSRCCCRRRSSSSSGSCCRG
jgi:hypothetical protein